MIRKILPLLLLILAAPAMAQDSAEKITPLLEQALAGDIAIASEADGSWAVWVHFTDKNLDGAALTAQPGSSSCRQSPNRQLAPSSAISGNASARL